MFDLFRVWGLANQMFGRGFWIIYIIHSYTLFLYSQMLIDVGMIAKRTIFFRPFLQPWLPRSARNKASLRARTLLYCLLLNDRRMIFCRFGDYCFSELEPTIANVRLLRFLAMAPRR